MPVGFGGPLPGQNPYQQQPQFGPGFGGPAPPGYADEPQPETEPEREQEAVEEQPPPAAEEEPEDAKSGADTVYASNGGYVYQRAK